MLDYDGNQRLVLPKIQQRLMKVKTLWEFKILEACFKFSSVRNANYLKKGLDIYVELKAMIRRSLKYRLTEINTINFI